MHNHSQVSKKERSRRHRTSYYAWMITHTCIQKPKKAKASSPLLHGSPPACPGWLCRLLPASSQPRAEPSSTYPVTREDILPQMVFHLDLPHSGPRSSKPGWMTVWSLNVASAALTAIESRPLPTWLCPSSSTPGSLCREVRTTRRKSSRLLALTTGKWMM